MHFLLILFSFKLYDEERIELQALRGLRLEQFAHKGVRFLTATLQSPLLGYRV